MSIRELQQHCWRTAEDKGFHDDRPAGGTELQHWQGNKIALMHSELSEALEELRTGKRASETYYQPERPGKPEGVPSELADVVIRILDFCGTEDIDLESIIDVKLAYNASRPYKHGKSF